MAVARKPDKLPGEVMRRVRDGPHLLAVEVVRDRRLHTSARWTVDNDTIQVRVPLHVSREKLDQLLDDIIARVLKQRARARQQNDADLERRAHDLNCRYFDGELRWHTIRWVSNMAHRLGSCTTGGATDGDIRISERIQNWPAYVVDYILAHELAHRRFPNHSAEFWEFLARYPHTERARGFIEGLAYAQGSDPDELI
jgi:predicted metal-dependent hydrolase